MGVDRPETPLPLPDTAVVVGRGPFKLAADQVLSEDVMPMNERDLSKIVRKLVKKHQLELQRQLA